ncbi:MAG: MBL fold metallo-hydrolase [Solibacillus sp.]
MTDVRIIPIECKFGPTSAYAYYIDAPEPALIDTGIAASASQEIRTVLEENGFRIEDIQWILLTHGHVDHLGGAHAVWEKTNRQAKVVIPQKEAYLLKNRELHIRDYENLQGVHLDEETKVRHKNILLTDIGDSLEPALEVAEGDKIDLGAGITLTVIETPGHSLGSVTFILDGANYAFAADAVQVCGGALSGIPTIESPALYRKSIERLIELNPVRLYLGHYFRNAAGKVYDAVIEGADVESALRDSLAMDAKLAQLMKQHVGQPVEESVYGKYGAVAEVLQYKGDPRNLPCAFFVTVSGYEKELTFVEGGTTR